MEIFRFRWLTNLDTLFIILSASGIWGIGWWVHDPFLSAGGGFILGGVLMLTFRRLMIKQFVEARHAEAPEPKITAVIEDSLRPVLAVIITDRNEKDRDVSIEINHKEISVREAARQLRVAADMIEDQYRRRAAAEN